MSLGLMLGVCVSAAVCRGAEERRIEIDLRAAAALEQWHVTDKRASADNGELRLDGRQTPCRAFLKTPAFGDVALAASYLVEDSAGVMAVGFVIGSTDSATSTYVHYDANGAILCRGDADKPWQEIRRTGKKHKPGTWYAARVERKGSRVSVFFDNKLLYETECAGEPGLVGFYASQTVGHIKDIVVSGTLAAPKTEWKPISVLQKWVHVCTDAGAGAYEAFPDVCRTADGRLLAVFYAGYGHIALPNETLPKGGRLSGCFSSDEGATWSEAFTLFDGPYDDRDPSVTRLKDGRLACVFFTLKPKPDGQKGWDALGSFIVTSADNGKTWETEPRQIAKDYYCSSPIRELPDGRLALGLYAANAKGAWGAATFSADGGKTWCKPIDIPTGDQRYDAETDLIPLKDGSLFAALRGRTISAWSVSKDGGKSWSAAEQFGFPGHCHYLHRAPGDIILMAHRLPATSLHYSLDECKTWSTNVLVDTVGGAYPSLETLKDGTILIVYYEEGPGSSIRAKRFRATRQGIEWLPIGAVKPEIRSFSDGGTNRIPCTVYPPTKTDPMKPAGLVVHLPGAGGGHTNYNLSRPPYAALRQMLADRGYWVVVPSLGNSWMNDTAVTSLDAIIARMREAEGIDPARVHIIGTSMGAGSGLVYVSKRPEAVRSICAIFPMTDFNAWMKETPRFAGSIAQAYGLDNKALEQLFQERSPVRNPNAFAAVPVYLLHGDRDDIVQPHHSRDFAAVLKINGCRVTYREVPGFAHQDEIAEAYQKEIADFLTDTGVAADATK
jgi:pimeloyl-ACP methyl ester carboxylesterase